MARRLAVTGANGFVGRHLVRAARAAGWEVVGLVRSAAAGRSVGEDGGQPAEVRDLEATSVARAIAGCHAVVHLAQIGAERDGATYELVNVEGTRRVLAAAQQAGATRLVYFSGLGVARYGLARRCTNRYFLSKLTAEVELFRSNREVVVFRPSYIVGPGDGLVADALEQMAAGEVERVGSGAYRMQPIAVRDATAAVLAAVESVHPGSRVFDLVGPEPLSYAQLLDRIAHLARSLRALGDYRIREVAVAEAERRAAEGGGYRGMAPDELDCLLCDEISDRRPLEALLGRFLTPLDEALAAAVRAVRFESRTLPQ